MSPLLLLLMLLGAGIAVLALRGWALDAGLLEDTRPLPNRTRHLLDAASMDPMEVAIAARVIALTSEERGSVLPAPADNRITLRVPAAYLAGVKFHNEGPYNRGALALPNSPSCSGTAASTRCARTISPTSPPAAPASCGPAPRTDPTAGGWRRGGAAANTRCACR